MWFSHSSFKAPTGAHPMELSVSATLFTPFKLWYFNYEVVENKKKTQKNIKWLFPLREQCRATTFHIQWTSTTKEMVSNFELHSSLSLDETLQVNMEKFSIATDTGCGGILWDSTSYRWCWRVYTRSRHCNVSTNSSTRTKSNFSIHSLVVHSEKLDNANVNNGNFSKMMKLRNFYEPDDYFPYELL